MASEGKYVRQVEDQEITDQESVYSGEAYEDKPNEGEVENRTFDDSIDSRSSSDGSSISSDDSDSNDEAPITQDNAETIKEGSGEKSETLERLERMEKSMAALIQALGTHGHPSVSSVTLNTVQSDVDQDWNSVHKQVDRSAGLSTRAAVRWDHIKPFPSGIAANKMWESWNKYMENFEIAASLGNANDRSCCS